LIWVRGARTFQELAVKVDVLKVLATVRQDNIARRKYM
jgi:hypothetical protein